MGLDIQMRTVMVATGLVGQAGACHSSNKGELGGGSAGQGRVAQAQQGVTIVNDSSSYGAQWINNELIRDI